MTAADVLLRFVEAIGRLVGLLTARETVQDGLVVVGVILVVLGVSAWSVPLGMIVLGLSCIGLAWRLSKQ